MRALWILRRRPQLAMRLNLFGVFAGLSTDGGRWPRQSVLRDYLRIDAVFRALARVADFVGNDGQPRVEKASMTPRP